MENLYTYLEPFVKYEAFEGVFTNKTKDNTEFKKAKINLINLKGENIYQIEKFTEKQAFHKNVNSNEIIEELSELFKFFMEFTFNANGFSHHIKLTKKGTILYNKKSNSSEILIKNHNKEKAYLLKEGNIMYRPPKVRPKNLTNGGRYFYGKI